VRQQLHESSLLRAGSYLFFVACARSAQRQLSQLSRRAILRLPERAADFLANP